MNVISLFEKYYKQGTSCLLESVSTHSRTGRHSIIAAEPEFIFRSWGNIIQIDDEPKHNGDPISELNNIFLERKQEYDPCLPPFTGGAVGYIGYDAVRLWENLGEKAEKDISIPDIYLLFYDNVIVYDHFLDKVFEFGKKMGGMGSDPLAELGDSKFTPLESPAYGRGSLEANARGLKPRASFFVRRVETFLTGFTKFRPTISKEAFTEMVLKAKEYISAGDIYQANLSQRLEADADINGWALYKRLRNINPSPFAGYMNLDNVELISCSPERLVKVEGKNIQTRPIAGTYPRSKDISTDKELARNLILNPKERAEHIMLVDLERNDLGRVCEYGSVKVDECMIVESYSHVHHIVSNVQGILEDNTTQMDVLKAVFPGGTITGCPKIRCMQIIDELEPARRNVYTGCMGWIGYNGNMDLNIIIRTILKVGSKLYLQAGAGIVADSVPEKEYNETLHKAGALMDAVMSGSPRQQMLISAGV